MKKPLNSGINRTNNSLTYEKYSKTFTDVAGQTVVFGITPPAGYYPASVTVIPIGVGSQWLTATVNTQFVFVKLDQYGPQLTDVAYDVIVTYKQF